MRITDMDRDTIGTANKEFLEEFLDVDNEGIAEKIEENIEEFGGGAWTEEPLGSARIGEESEIKYHDRSTHDVDLVAFVNIPLDTFVHTHAPSTYGMLSQKVSLEPGETLFANISTGLDPDADAHNNGIWLFNTTTTEFVQGHLSTNKLDRDASQDGGAGVRWSSYIEYINTTGSTMLVQAFYSNKWATYGNTVHVGDETHLYLSKSNDGNGELPEQDIVYTAQVDVSNISKGNSYAVGKGVKAVFTNQHNVGTYNDVSNLDLIFSIGNGVSDSERSNILEVNGVSGALSLPKIKIDLLEENDMIPKKVHDYDIKNVRDKFLTTTARAVKLTPDILGERTISKHGKVIYINEDLILQVLDKHLVPLFNIDMPDDASSEYGVHIDINEDYIAVSDSENDVDDVIKGAVYLFDHLGEFVKKLNYSVGVDDDAIGEKFIAFVGSRISASTNTASYGIISWELGTWAEYDLKLSDAFSDYSNVFSASGNSELLVLGANQEPGVELLDSDLNLINVLDGNGSNLYGQVIHVGSKVIYVASPNYKYGKIKGRVYAYDFQGAYLYSFYPVETYPNILTTYARFGGGISENDNGDVVISSYNWTDINGDLPNGILYVYTKGGHLIQIINGPNDISLGKNVNMTDDNIIVSTKDGDSQIIYSTDITLKDDLVTVNTSTFPTELQSYFGIFDNKLDNVIGWMSNYMFYEQVSNQTGLAEYDIDLIRVKTHNIILTEDAIINNPINLQIGRTGTIVIKQDDIGDKEVTFSDAFELIQGFTSDDLTTNLNWLTAHSVAVINYRVIDIDWIQLTLEYIGVKNG